MKRVYINKYIYINDDIHYHCVNSPDRLRQSTEYRVLRIRTTDGELLRLGRRTSRDASLLRIPYSVLRTAYVHRVVSLGRQLSRCA